MLLFLYSTDSRHDPTSKLNALFEEAASNGHVLLDPEGLTDEEHAAILLRSDSLVVYPVSLWTDNDPYIRLAKTYGIPIYGDTIPARSPIEHDYPEQARTFLRMAVDLYALHLRKCSDYGTSNISLTGMHGVLVRVGDKIMRLLSLAGFTITIAKSTVGESKAAYFESSEDSWQDLSSYGIIARLLLRGVWGT
jgi:hypothetical protein